MGLLFSEPYIVHSYPFFPVEFLLSIPPRRIPQPELFPLPSTQTMQPAALRIKESIYDQYGKPAVVPDSNLFLEELLCVQLWEPGPIRHHPCRRALALQSRLNGSSQHQVCCRPALHHACPSPSQPPGPSHTAPSLDSTSLSYPCQTPQLCRISAPLLSPLAASYCLDELL